MSGQIVGMDPETGILRTLHYDPVTEQVVIDTAQHVDDIVEAAKGHHRMFDERSNWKGDLHRVASIPLTILFDLQRKGILDDEVAFKKWLNDPDNAVFRTRPGRV